MASIPAHIKKQMQKALVKTTDMTPEQEQEVVDTVVGVIDKQTGPDGLLIEPAAKAVKEALDKQYGAQWHCIIGKGFSYDVTAQTGSLMFVFYQGEIAALVFKC
mmetsp:Transcript_11558/g.28120  ORF Transcript_11558/g.28120 Transcript_11558/m.28120 type:complete len:104 (+) Transcript_11558:163-474(+)|eukprot:CAMPEP_0178998354 /NCGR_PEP_ID=MMETSP0795-20121207/9469_1 /TAXON_ID=88552 /ORGANISM="Amoebophrya sp., Strain Ameob2" /LENGTH=103 /DNA_ID=CAMNT_0020691029 /DNA_START=125 /DNA_END=436 /DNA_ORIENTATION=-